MSAGDRGAWSPRSLHLEELSSPEVEDALERGFREGFDAISSNGILGDARGATAALGDRLLEGEAALLAEHFAG